jgi:isopropylmalate/homocitrate/citramalate synthase
VLVDPQTYEPFAPETVGSADREIVLGKHSGRSAIRAMLHAQGFDGDQQQVEEALSRLRMATG